MEDPVTTNPPVRTQGEQAQLDHRFLIRADFSSTPLNDEDPIWIKAPDGEVSSVTWAEFRGLSKLMLYLRPLPDGKLT